MGLDVLVTSISRSRSRLLAHSAWFGIAVTAWLVKHISMIVKINKKALVMLRNRTYIYTQFDAQNAGNSVSELPDFKFFKSFVHCTCNSLLCERRPHYKDEDPSHFDKICYIATDCQEFDWSFYSCLIFLLIKWEAIINDLKHFVGRKNFFTQNTIGLYTVFLSWPVQEACA